MLFNSLDFAIFFIILFSVYWYLYRSPKAQNVLILFASYFFYAYWDWRFLSLIIISTLTDFSVGKLLYKETNYSIRKTLLLFSVGVNLGLLGFFKYHNFFIDSFINAFSFFGLNLNVFTLNLILPVGISFYTLQTLSYTIDIYRKNTEPTNNLIVFAAFVSFFPQLLAGPIERAANLIPQFLEQRKFSYKNTVEGCRQFLWGLFKKMVIADNCAQLVDLTYSNTADHTGSTLFLGAIFFSIQIYCDFSGYSDMAIGLARTLGIKLKQNFAFPFFSRNMAELWRRWHISLNEWFRDYLYIPLGGSKRGMSNTLRNIFIVFCISGLWHGANWTFIVWGLLNAIFIVPVFLFKTNKSYTHDIANQITWREIVGIATTNFLFIVSFIFFRAESITHAIVYIKGIFEYSIFLYPALPKQLNSLYILIPLMFLIEWFRRSKKHPLEDLQLVASWSVRWGIYATIFFVIGVYGHSDKIPFIYFQF